MKDIMWECGKCSHLNRPDLETCENCDDKEAKNDLHIGEIQN